jgi:prevent-host-death family protein
MPSYSVASTKDNLSSLIDKAQAGEEVIITRRGKPAAKIVPATVPKKPCKDVAAATAQLREQLRALPPIKADIPYYRFRDWLYSEEDH